MTGFSILVGHLVGDYLLQNDWLANRKVYNANNELTHSPLPCLIHVTLYTLASFAAVEFANVATGAEMWPAWAWAVIAVTHWFMDRYRLAARWMDVIGQRGFKEHMSPWSVIIVDNSIHLLTAWIVALAVALLR